MTVTIKRFLSQAKALYLKIAEPRLPRLAHSMIYSSTMVAGLVAWIGLPPILVSLIGPTMVTVFGGFSFAGSLIALIAVIPGVPWLERSGVILLLTAVLIYIIMIIYANVTTVALWLVIPLAVMLTQHLIDIRPGNLYGQ